MPQLRVQVSVTRTVVRKLCPHCKERPVGKRFNSVTCGHPFCQFKNQILRMRKRRKTDRVVVLRRIEI